jgi:hypothetical protein
MFHCEKKFQCLTQQISVVDRAAVELGLRIVGVSFHFSLATTILLPIKGDRTRGSSHVEIVDRAKRRLALRINVGC